MQQFVDGASNGFLVFTLGSNAKASRMPDKTKRIFVRVFSRIRERVLWKMETSQEQTILKYPASVKVVDWLPQQDLLGKQSKILAKLVCD